MDDRELRTLFREAPGEPPAPSFGVHDVTTRSRRLAARRRHTIGAAFSCLVLVLAGLGAIGVIVNMQGHGENATTAAVDPSLRESEQPEVAPQRLPHAGSAQDFPDQSPKQGGEGSGENGPRAESTLGCDKVDRELAIALAGELPVTAPGQATPGRICSPDWPSAGFHVQDGDRSGQVSATLIPPGTAVQYAGQPEGTALAERPTANGGTVVVLSVPDPGSPGAPAADRIEQIAADLAARF